MAPVDLDWSAIPNGETHADRLALLRGIDFTATPVVEVGNESPLTEDLRVAGSGRGLSLNLSRGGMLLLMDDRPEPEQVLRLKVPLGMYDITIPTLAEVRWVRRVPFPQQQSLYFVGLKFLF